jgi:DNA-binding NarL/FixJ family response regulator
MRGKQIRQNQNVKRGRDRWARPRKFEFSALMIIRCSTVDDHPLVNEAIAAIINSQPDMQLVAKATSGSDAVRQFRQHRPDITLMDLRLPDMSGIDTMIAIRAEFPEARIIMLTTFQGDVEIQRALEGGARGYLLKSCLPRIW